MIRAITRSLGARILLVASANLFLLFAVVLLAAGVRLPRSPPDILVQAASQRLLDVSRQAALDLWRTSAAEADAVLERYSERYGARFVLALNSGNRVAGAELTIPPAVVAAIVGHGPDAGRRLRVLPPDRAGPFGERPPEEPHGAAPVGSAPRLPQAPPFLITVDEEPRYWIGVRTPVQFAGSTTIAPGTLLLVSSTLLQNSLLVPPRLLIWTLVAVGVTVVCWWPLLRGITTSLKRMERATEGIAEGRFDTALGIGRTDEIGRLSASMERMAARLSALVSGHKRFLGDTAHELRSPLGRMQVALEILESRVPPKERAYVHDLKEEVEALGSLTDELLEYARAELGSRTLAPMAVDVGKVATRIADRESANGARIDVRVPETLQVYADAALFERALANVVRNAVRYAGEAGPIEISATAENGGAAVTVSDVGPGVSVGSLERIFEPFYREDPARSRRTGGVGIGLAIVRSAIEACGGRVNCRNREPNGLEVRLWLPMPTAGRRADRGDTRGRGR